MTVRDRARPDDEDTEVVATHTGDASLFGRV